MNTFQKISLLLLRLSLGWLMFYAGITKIVDPAWSAAGYLTNAQTFQSIYAWFAQPAILPVTNFLNEWGLTLIGISLIVGAFVRLSSTLGILLMLLYYFPVLTFPTIGAHSFLVDEHIIYALVFLLLLAYRAGRVWGLDTWFSKKAPRWLRFLS